MIEQSFEKIKCGIYPQNADFGDLPIGYKQILFVERPMYRLTNNNVERLNVSSIKRLVDNRRYKINHRNANFGDLPFDGDEMLIARRRLYRIKQNIVFS